MPSWTVSVVLHAVLIVGATVLVLPRVEVKTVTFEASEATGESVGDVELNLDADLDMAEEAFETESESMDEMVELLEESAPELEIDLPTEQFTDTDIASDIFATAEESGVGETIGKASEFASRSSQSERKRLLAEYGGSPESEGAVDLALEWIVKHQLPDGGWNFDHRTGSGSFRKTPGAGSLSNARNAATALALLPLLGNGQTHRSGKYQDVVQRGLAYLTRRGQPHKAGGISWHEPDGTMYSHGLVAITICEAYAMTRDPELRPFAAAGIRYIEDSQNREIGGWKYAYREPGDTSVVGWQVMALKSAKISGIKMDPRTFSLVTKFLDHVSIENGAFYLYESRDEVFNKGDRGRTAIGILCRMYLGWERDHPSLFKAVKWLDDVGPDTDGAYDAYYNYYATQVMKQYGGNEWERWNSVMRDHLVDSQEKSGDTAGSWYQNEKNTGTEKGGRLYCTALACMTLEVYYRFLPLYSKKVVDYEFPLD